MCWSKVEKSDSGVDPITHDCDCFVTAGRSPDLPDVASAKRKPTDLTQLPNGLCFHASTRFIYVQRKSDETGF